MISTLATPAPIPAIGMLTWAAVPGLITKLLTLAVCITLLSVLVALVLMVTELLDGSLIVMLTDAYWPIPIVLLHKTCNPGGVEIVQVPPVPSIVAKLT